jgi:membrane protein
LASAAFRIYLDVAASGNPVFGTLGGGLILLVWLYLLAFGLLLGAEVNGLLLSRTPGKTATPT